MAVSADDPHNDARVFQHWIPKSYLNLGRIRNARPGAPLLFGYLIWRRSWQNDVVRKIFLGGTYTRFRVRVTRCI